MEAAYKCGCKGIRTCLICEKEENLTNNDVKETVQYQFCSWCGLCWPVGDTSARPPLYLSLLTLVPEFVNVEEEEQLKIAIDSIDWMPSQSGRRKQDFGPKVNFKKKKSKIGCFKGFPCFTEPLIKRFEQCDDLLDFQPVELCHLDYDPDRGSAIEPHTDDTWIWGERLVTLNLVSSTVLTLTPANAEGPCDCQNHCLNMSASFIEENRQCLNVSASSNDHCTADHDACIVWRKSSSNGIGKNKVIESLGFTGKSFKAFASHARPVKRNIDQDGPLCITCKGDLYHVNDHIATSEQGDCTITKNGHCNLKDPLYCQTKCSKAVDACNVSQHGISNLSLQTDFDYISLDKKSSNSSEDVERKTRFSQNKLSIQKKILSCAHRTLLNREKSISIKDMCTIHRIGNEQPNIEVLVPLPARSLVVLAGCSRHNWFHEIKRKDILSRRLAMTFRELAPDFMPGGSEENIGCQLLELGHTFLE